MSTPKDAQSILDQINSEAMSRQDIYQALNQVSKDDFLDHEMKRLGFWDPDKTTAEESALSKLIEDKKEIEAKLVESLRTYSGRAAHARAASTSGQHPKAAPAQEPQGQPSHRVAQQK